MQRWDEQKLSTRVTKLNLLDYPNIYGTRISNLGIVEEGLPLCVPAVAAPNSKTLHSFRHLNP